MEISLIIIKTLSIIVGFSSALVNDILTFRFLKDFKIDKGENKVLQTLAGISLISALLLSLSLLASIFYKVSLIDQNVLISSSIILAIVVFNEIIFRRIIIYRLAHYRTESPFIDITKVVLLRRVAFYLNIVSVISWIYLLLIFQFELNKTAFFTEAMIGDYVLICSLAIIITNWIYNLKNR